MRELRLTIIVGARPNFMKVAPIVDALNAARSAGATVAYQLVHTGQHYDARMSGAFFDDLGLPRPDINLEIGSGSHAEQTGRTMMAVEPVLTEFAPHVLIVVGDVNSTIACALTATKMGIKVAHVEAGLRSGDRTMPEEINRLGVDAIADILYTTDSGADANLAHEGVPAERVVMVGNVMIDTLEKHRARAAERGYAASLGLTPQGYATMTLHRPANVDTAERFVEILDALRDGLGDLPVIFPIHPRTRAKAETFGLMGRFINTPGAPGIYLTEPLGYLEFLDLNANAALVATDSGGLQEETTILGVPCVTLRDNTERPITVSEGTNRLAGTRRAGILAGLADALAATGTPSRPPLWDGRSGTRIVADLIARHNAQQTKPAEPA